MKQRDKRNRSSNSSFYILEQQIAYHEAGHAAAIHFNNRLKKLPPVFFKILLDNSNECVAVNTLKCSTSSIGSISRTKGGRLIHLLPFALEDMGPETHDSVVSHYTDGYHPAFEADIVNLLVGPLAEAKFITLMDNELFRFQLLTVPALNNYGGEADLALVYEYLQSYSADPQVQDQCLGYFFKQAFEFVNDRENWNAITQLADYILASNKNEISCEEAVAALESELGMSTD